jgi:hypothetical protein
MPEVINGKNFLRYIMDSHWIMKLYYRLKSSFSILRVGVTWEENVKLQYSIIQYDEFIDNFSLLCVYL